MTLRPFTFAEKVKINLEIEQDLDLIRTKLIESLAVTREGEKGHKALIRAHASNEKLRRELFHCWYAEPRADAPLLTEKRRV
jgi:hypothetical protein